jgi:hypothetical protein
MIAAKSGTWSPGRRSAFRRRWGLALRGDVRRETEADLVEAVPVRQRQRRLSPRERVDVFRLFEIMRGRVAARTSARKKVLGAR